MKSSRTQKNRPERVTPASDTPNSEQSFYEQGGNYAPLDGSLSGGGAQSSRPSQRSAARRRENNCRASDKTLLFLVIKIFMIPVLLVLAYIVLKIGLGYLVGPSEKEIETWEKKAELMELGAANDVAVAVELPGSAGEIQVDKALLEARLGQWKQAEQNMRAAEALYRRGIDQDAIVRLKQVLRFAPDHQEAQRMLLEIYMRADLYEEALPLCVRLLDWNSQEEEVTLNLLDALLMTEKLDAALLLADQILVEQPNNVKALEVVAYAQAALGNTQEALDAYDHILENSGSHKLALSGSAYIYHHLGQWAEAIPYYSELIRIEATLDLYHALAQCYAHLGESGKVAIYMGQAASLYGEKEVTPWLKEADFDSVRETIEFRSFTDQVVGTENRKAIEQLRRQETQVEKPLFQGGLEVDVPEQQDLLKLKPTR